MGGGISHRGKNPARVSYSFCTEVKSRCLVELFRKYLFLGPRGVLPLAQILCSN